LENLIIVRYSEIFLKGNNRAFFENLLVGNIKFALSDIDCAVSKSRGRILIEGFNSSAKNKITERLKKVFGIHTFSFAVKTKTDLNAIYAAAEEFIGKGTFKVNCGRANKTFYLNSMQVSAEIGGMILQKHPHLKVDLHNPDFIINIDIRENGVTFVFSQFIEGAHGLPSGASGKGMLMLSGGIDSPVAGYLMGKRGMKIKAVHFYSYPYTSEYAKQKVISLCKKLSEYNGVTELFVVPFTEIQEQINKNCAHHYTITIMRRFMMRIAEMLAVREGAGAIINGESLGQVASQTVESINVTNATVKLPVFRPLIGLDKLDIINIAVNIDTYEISIQPYEDCCTVFVPKNPVIKPNIAFAEKEEAKLDVVGLIESALAGTERLLIS
jgi:thiamine biosynthesis protein ThiI